MSCYRYASSATRLLQGRSWCGGVRGIATTESTGAGVPATGSIITGLADTSTLLDQFRDSLSLEELRQEVGRSWHARELRRKSFDDLHRLWYVLYKEKNMLLTERQICRSNRLEFPQPERFRKVQKSMGAIKQVMGERKREKIAQFEHKKKMDAAEAAAPEKEPEDWGQQMCDKEKDTQKV
jgi:large subunit ribosomal protein L47